MLSDRAQYAAECLNDFRAAIVAQQQAAGKKLAGGAPLNEWNDPEADRELDRARARAKAVLDEVHPGWRAVLEKKSWHQTEDSVINRIAGEQVVALTEGDEIRIKLRGDADEIVGGALHSWVWTVEVARRWHKGEYADAVDEASKAVNYSVQSKVCRNDLGEVKLFQQVYSIEPASKDKPRLRFGDPNTVTERDRRQGAMQLSAGWYTAVRNLLAHRAGLSLEKYPALEYLAALSIIARWADEATVDTGTDNTGRT